MKPSHHRHFFLAPALLFSLALGARAQATWHVDIAGTPPGSGTVAAPYTSIAYALAQPSTAPGDTLLIEDGHYVESSFQLAGHVLRGVHGPERTIVQCPEILIAGFLTATIEGLTLLGPGPRGISTN